MTTDDDRSIIERFIGAIDTAARNYSATHVVRALVQLAGAALGSPEAGLAADAVLAQAFDIVKGEDKRRLTLLDEAFEEYVKDAESEPGRDPPPLGDFIHAVSFAMDRVRRTNRDKKIRLFARLLVGYYTGLPYENVDDYEEAARILDEISPKEIYIFATLRRLERRYEQTQGEKIDRTNPSHASGHYWDELGRRIQNGAGIRADDLMGAMARLTRTGLYYSTTTSEYGWMKERGCLTPNFETFALALKLEDNESQ